MTKTINDYHKEAEKAWGDGTLSFSEMWNFILSMNREILEDILNISEQRDLEAHAYKNTEPFGVLKTRDMPIFITPYRSTLKEYINKINSLLETK